jgi:SH3-like domain-containing protein
MLGLKLSRSVLAGVLAACGALGLGACGDHAGEGKECPEAQRHTASGFCVPRWLSLKRDDVLGRKGPGMDYPPLWVYHVKGLPVQVVAETSDWRKICDPDGGSVWVHRLMLDGRRTVMVLGAAPLPLHRKESADSPVSGLINGRALASLDRCEGAWCKLKAGGVSGWVPGDQVWGVATAPQCH